MGKYTSIGGQALIEGIMMKSPEKAALAVRLPDKSIDITYLESKSVKDRFKILKLPILRGVVGFVESMIQGYKAMMLSADKSGFTDIEDEENEKPMSEKGKNALISVIMIIGTVLGVALSVGLFMYLPRFAIDGICYIFGTSVENMNFFLELSIEQLIKLTVFVLYVLGVSFMKDIKRVFMYHGAEHKTIFCYEKGLPLTVENVRKMRRFHPRCGTSFMILMILVSILISTLVLLVMPWLYSNRLLWVAIKILLIPVVCGAGYEILKICGKYDNILTKIISAPGLWLQRITTKEPDDDMIEIAIAALKAAEPEVPDVDRSADEAEEGGEITENDNI